MSAVSNWGLHDTDDSQAARHARLKRGAPREMRNDKHAEVIGAIAAIMMPHQWRREDGLPDSFKNVGMMLAGILFSSLILSKES